MSGLSTHVLVVGAGVAGIAAALSAAHVGADVSLVTEGAELERGGNTQLAQGGIAAAIGPLDTPEKHASDTIAAGAGLVDAAAARVLTTGGAVAIRALIAAGFAVDRALDGDPALGIEGAHGERRIVHAGEDRSGAALHAFLRAQVMRLVRGGRVGLLSSRTAVRAVKCGGAVSGIELRNASGTITRHSADAVVIATGGYAGLFPRSTNAAGSQGAGILLAARAGALLADLEFVQFHPTVLHGSGALVSEAVRGAGATLLDGSGRRFMAAAHPLGDLAPRDVVSREIHRVMRERGDVSVWIDATEIERAGGDGTLAHRFPAITAAVRAQGFDWTREPVPVSPAAHYSMGGIMTDLHGRTSVPGLFAAGEAAATGVHGANRLASNSLLEGLVFGKRAGLAAATPRAVGEAAAYSDPAARRAGRGALLDVPLPDLSCADIAGSGSAVADAIADGLGIVRNADGLRTASRVFTQAPGHPAAQLASLIAAAAEARTESRGAHHRSDYPDSCPAQAERRVVRAVYRAGARPPAPTAAMAAAGIPVTTM